MYLLDTNVCINFIKGNADIVRRLSSVAPSTVYVRAIVKAELLYGAMRSNNPSRTQQVQKAFLSQFHSFPFDDQAALIHGRIRAQLAAQGTPIGPYDSQIAAITLTHHITLVTNNTREFCRVENLNIEDWQIGV
jgi:tRNA(fMet)-specific endonuclease VapC